MKNKLLECYLYFKLKQKLVVSSFITLQWRERWWTSVHFIFIGRIYFSDAHSQESKEKERERKIQSGAQVKKQIEIK